MGYVYLISEDCDGTKYKIGSTRKKKNVNDRVKELQTGNPNELKLINSYETDNPFKLEGMLHRHFNEKNELNEWFNLNDSDISSFYEICEKYQKIINCLKNNPFFK